MSNDGVPRRDAGSAPGATSVGHLSPSPGAVPGTPADRQQRRHGRPIGEHVARSAPLEIIGVEFHDPVLALSGKGWALTAMCPWRVLRGDALDLSWSTPDAADRAWDLIGRQIVGAEQRGRDAVLRLSDGSSIELFSDTDTDPWILRLPGHTFVGPLPPG